MDGNAIHADVVICPHRNAVKQAKGVKAEGVKEEENSDQ